MLTSCTLPWVMRINVGILPCRSSSVCIFTAPLCWRNFAHGNRERQRSMVVESSAYRLCSRSTPIASPEEVAPLRRHFDVIHRGAGFGDRITDLAHGLEVSRQRVPGIAASFLFRLAHGRASWHVRGVS